MWKCPRRNEIWLKRQRHLVIFIKCGSQRHDVWPRNYVPLLCVVPHTVLGCRLSSVLMVVAKKMVIKKVIVVVCVKNEMPSG